MNRSDLHTLIETLPEGALENAHRVLQHLQVWPPQLRPETQRMREIGQEQMDRMRRSIRPGTIGGGGGGYRFDPATGFGHSGFTRWEDDTAVQETHHFYKGHEIAVTERLRLTHEGKVIHYTHEAKGPKGILSGTKQTSISTRLLGSSQAHQPGCNHAIADKNHGTVGLAPDGLTRYTST